MGVQQPIHKRQHGQGHEKDKKQGADLGLTGAPEIRARRKRTDRINAHPPGFVDHGQ